MTVKLPKHPNPQYWSDVIVQNAPAGIITVDGQMLITEINPAAEKLMGYSRDAALGQPYIEILYGGQSGKEGPLEMALSARKVLTKRRCATKSFWRTDTGVAHRLCQQGRSRNAYRRILNF